MQILHMTSMLMSLKLHVTSKEYHESADLINYLLYNLGFEYWHEKHKIMNKYLIIFYHTFKAHIFFNCTQTNPVTKQNNVIKFILLFFFIDWTQAQMCIMSILNIGNISVWSWSLIQMAWTFKSKIIYFQIWGSTCHQYFIVNQSVIQKTNVCRAQQQHLSSQSWDKACKLHW